jgi:arylsulfatase A-like enzyme
VADGHAVDRVIEPSKVKRTACRALVGSNRQEVTMPQESARGTTRHEDGGTRWNVLYIDCHDLGDWLGCCGHPYLRTPAIDDLAARGAIFRRCFATAPICMPSRAGLYTGRYPHASGAFGQCPLAREAVGMASLFRAGGYQTTLIGDLLIPNDPAWFGFEAVVPAQRRESATADFLRTRSETDPRPWFAMVSFGDVHRPYGTDYDPEVAASIIVPAGLPDLPLVRCDLAVLARRITEFDAKVGVILDALKESREDERTIVAFTTEHGLPLPRHKHTLYDPGIATALVLAAPGLISGGVIRHELLSNIDLLPTMLELCGLPAPSDLHGRSFASLLVGGTYREREEVFSEHTWGRRSGKQYYTPMRSVRTHTHKYIRNWFSEPVFVDTGWLSRFGADVAVPERWYHAPVPAEELYDLISDPHETRCLAHESSAAAVLADLRCRMESILTSTHDPIVTGEIPHPDGLFHAPQWERDAEDRFRLRDRPTSEQPLPGAAVAQG